MVPAKNNIPSSAFEQSVQPVEISSIDDMCIVLGPSLRPSHEEFEVARHCRDEPIMHGWVDENMIDVETNLRYG